MLWYILEADHGDAIQCEMDEVLAVCAFVVVHSFRDDW